MRALIDAISARWRILTGREKLLVGIMAACGVALVVTVLIVAVWSKLSDLEARIEGNDRVLVDLATRGDQLLEAQMERDKEQARFDKDPPALPGLLEKLAGESGIEIPESREMPDDTIGKKWVRKSVEVRLRRIGLKAFTDFMVKIENENRSFPLAITHMSVKRRAGEPDSYDVDLTVSTYTKVKSAKDAKKKKEKEKAGSEATETQRSGSDEARSVGNDEPVLYGPQS